MRAPARPHPDPWLVGLELVDVESGADDHIPQPVDPFLLVVAAIHPEDERTADRHLTVHVRERQREPLVERGGVRFHARIIALREHLIRRAHRILASRQRSSSA